MLMTTTEIIEKFQTLPGAEQQEVADFIEFLAARRRRQRGKRLRLDWAGGLKDLRGRYTSLELQKKGMDWWSEA
jgi:hypothetical protein